MVLCCAQGLVNWLRLVEACPVGRSGARGEKSLSADVADFFVAIALAVCSVGYTVVVSIFMFNLLIVSQ